MLGVPVPKTLLGTCATNWNLSGRGPSICSRRPFGHLKAPLGFHCFANANFTYLDNGNVNFPDNKKYSRSKPTIIRIPPTTLMPIRLTLLFFIILFAKTNSSAPTTIIKTDINGYMSFLLSNSDLLLNFVFKLYHKTCEQFYRNFGLYEKSPNSFLPGLPRSIINQFRFHNLLCLCLASVHLPHPFHLVFGFQLLGHAVLLCQ